MKMTKELCNKIILSIILFLASACIMDIAVYAQESNVSIFDNKNGYEINSTIQDKDNGLIKGTASGAFEKK